MNLIVWGDNSRFSIFQLGNERLVVRQYLKHSFSPRKRGGNRFPIEKILAYFCNSEMKGFHRESMLRR